MSSLARSHLYRVDESQPRPYIFREACVSLPGLSNLYAEYDAFCRSGPECKDLWRPAGERGHLGRWFDHLWTILHVDLAGKRVAELGTRDGLISACPTRWVERVHISDNFDQWGHLDGVDFWRRIWRAYAMEPEPTHAAFV